ncbi:ATP-dependent DNA helicase PIF1-like [Pieris napi]|uniref:ATP-dependent DNA helicase PIF1-like n=1 Tax=Pieris napi TaxID=78633 RepID=UPI001FBB9703|nr:ATP-dependent DNA helicase PIF1-like [Pieris napi]
MGGALLILSGDFRQTLPVIPKSTSADEINACLKKSHLWPQVQILQLTKNMRVELSRDETTGQFAKILLQIGEGTYPTDQTTGLIELNSDFCNIVTTEDELIDKIYPNIIQNYTNAEWLFQRAILATKNNIVDDINFNILKKIPGEEKIYKSIDTMVSIEESVNFPTEFLNSLQVPGMPLHCLRLKIGTPIILLRNLNSPKLCNGTRMIVKQLSNNIIEAELISGKTKGQTVFIPRIPLISSELPFQFKRLQFPIKLAFSFTINKAQGQTLKYCGINLKESCVFHGQLYVACSRVGNPKNLCIYTPDNKMKNVVYKQVL